MTPHNLFQTYEIISHLKKFPEIPDMKMATQPLLL